MIVMNMLFFSLSPVPFQVVLAGLFNHTASSPTGSLININLIGFISLDIVICLAIDTKNKQISEALSLDLVYKHWGRKFYLLSFSSCRCGNM